MRYIASPESPYLTCVLNEVTQLLRVVLEECGGAVGMHCIARVVDRVAGFAVVQVGAGLEEDGFLADGFVVILDERGVGPCLVRGVVGVALAASQKGVDDGILVGHLGLLPLFELNDDGGAAAVGLFASQNEVDAL
jgi:hypothetical protein